MLQDCYLFTYEDERGYTQGKAPTEMIDLRGHMRVSANPGATHKTPKLAFVLLGTREGQQDFHLAVIKEKELKPWLDALNNQIERVAKALAAQQKPAGQAAAPAPVAASAQ